MKSVKPGRGPSAMSAAGSAISILFGLVWTCAAASMSPIMAIFGILFIAMGVVNLIYHTKNATGEERYSLMDIVDENAEPDPLNEKFGKPGDAPSPAAPAGGESRFCPYCGAPVDEGYAFCPKCGKKLP